jgi:hypothetical protein
MHRIDVRQRNEQFGGKNNDKTPKTLNVPKREHYLWQSDERSSSMHARHRNSAGES